MRRHSGLTLIEMVAAIAVHSVVLGLSAALLALLISAERNGRERLETALRLDLLADQFRRDVHAASEREAAAEAAPAFLVLVFANQIRVRYELQANTLSRAEYAGDQVVRREAFRLPGDSELRLEPQANSRWLTLVLKEPGSDRRPAKEAWQVDAVLGRDHRYGRKPK